MVKRFLFFSLIILATVGYCMEYGADQEEGETEREAEIKRRKESYRQWLRRQQRAEREAHRNAYKRWRESLPEEKKSDETLRESKEYIE